MAGLPTNDVVESWTPEPELRESPPRRFEPVSADYPDLNQPSRVLYLGVGGGILIIGLGLLIAGLDHHPHRVGFIVLGVLFALAGAVVVGLYPVKLKNHIARAEQLVSFGVPVIARILSADNLTGDSTFARSVKYQVVMPGGDMAHRSVNADERLLPSRVPGDTTALMDMASGEVELYCALPLRAATRGEHVSRIPQAATPTYTAPAVTATAFQELPKTEPAPAGVPGAMPTLGGVPGQMSTLGSTPPPTRSAPRTAPEKAPEPAPSPSAQPAPKKESSAMPWE